MNCVFCSLRDSSEFKRILLKLKLSLYFSYTFPLLPFTGRLLKGGAGGFNFRGWKIVGSNEKVKGKQRVSKEKVKGK